jgi:hypothetical protein
MSDDARLALTLVCFTVALLAEVGGLALVVREARRAGRVLRRWQAADACDAADLRALVPELLGNPFDRGAAAVLLVVGVVFGAAGNFLVL